MRLESFLMAGVTLAVVGCSFAGPDAMMRGTFTAFSIRRYESVEIVEVEVSSSEPAPTLGNDHLYWKFNPIMWVRRGFSIPKRPDKLP